MNNVFLIRRCRVCGSLHNIEVTQEENKAWNAGAFVQDAFPNLSVDDREMLISGVCGECFDKMYAEEEEV